MSPFQPLPSPSARRLHQVLIACLTLSRLGLVAAIWWFYPHVLHMPAMWLATLYVSTAILIGAYAIWRQAQTAVWTHSIGLELGCMLSLLWILPDLNDFYVALPLLLSFAVALGYRPFGITMLTATLIFGWLFRSYQLHQPIDIPHQQGLILALWFIGIGLMSLRNLTPQGTALRNDIDPQTGFALTAQLEHAVTYLRPYHQRNQIPLSVLMIQIPAPHNTWRAVTNCLNQRLRNSDVVVRYGKQHIVLLLCDTNEHGASILAHHLHQDVSKDIDQHGVLFAISHLNVEGVALQPILERMQQVLKHAEHKTDRVLFVSPLIREESK